MSNLKIIKNRIRSVGNTKKIAQTMRMVSAAKYAKAERELKEVRSFGQGATQFYEIAEVNPPLKPESQLVIALTGDRGLCGAIHSGISKAIVADIEQSPKLKANTKIICVGEKNRAILSRIYPEKILWVASEVGKKPMTFLDAGLIAEQIVQTQADNDFRQTLIYYNKFVNAVSYNASTINLFEQRAIFESSKFLLYDDVSAETISCWVEFATVAMIYWLLKEGNTSEHASRMNAMENASKNAGEMIQGLILTYNRTRQAAITRELTEIISGASVVENK